MLFSCLTHHQNKNQNLGFFPNRFVYDVEVPEVARDVKRESRDVAGEEKKYKDEKDKLEPVRNERNVAAENVKKALQEYDQYITEEHIDFWTTKNWESFKGLENLMAPIFAAWDQLPNTLKIGEEIKGLDPLIVAITAKEADVPNQIQEIGDPSATPPRKGYGAEAEDYRAEVLELLANIKEQIRIYREKLEAAKLAEEKFEREVLQPHGQKLDQLNQLTMKHIQERTGFEKEPVYQRLKTKFDLALRDPKFQEFKELEGEASPVRAREMEQLFFSTLAENTDGFKDTVNKGFLLGRDFSSNDWEANRRNFPFLYNEWLKHEGVNQEQVVQAENLVQAREQVLKDQNIRSVEDLIKKETGGTPPLIVESRLKDLGPAPALDEDLLEYHKNREAVVYDLAQQYFRLATKTETGTENTPKRRKDDAGEYRQRAKQLLLHFDLEKAQVALFEWKTREDAKKRFTREHLTAPAEEQWLLEVAMEQFARAVKIVDNPALNFGTNQFDYHPAVRRMMIAMIYREGTARWTADGKVDDDIANEYTSFLSESARSNDFNARLRGVRFLPDQAKNYLFLARYSNLMRIRIPELTKTVKDLSNALTPKKAEINTKFAINLDALGTYDVEKVKVEPTLIEAGLNYKKETVKIKLIDSATRTALTGLPINPDDSDATLETTQRNNCNAVIAPTTPPATPFTPQQIEAAKKVLAYIDEVKRLNDLDASAGDKKELIDAGKEAGVRNLNADAALATKVLNYLTERERLALYQSDAQKVDRYVHDQNYIDPITGVGAAEFLQGLRTRPGVEGDTKNEKILGDWTKYADSVERRYDLFDLQKNSRMDYLNRMGINIEGCHQQYRNYIKANPDMRVDQWEKYFINDDPKEYDKLVELFRNIIPTNERGGKLDFLITFENWHPSRKREVTSENREQGNLAMSIYHILKAEIEQREKIAAASARGEQEVVTKLEGMNIGEKLTKYGSGVLNLLIGPGQSLTNRATGMVLIYGAWKAARAAMKGDTTAGKGLRTLFLLGAAEVAMKEITGRGLLDRANVFDSMGEAIEGTYEAVLVQRGIEGVNAEQHTAALYELNTVPFHVAMEWYDKTDPEGNPLPGQESNCKQLWGRGMKVDIGRVCPSKVDWKEIDKEREAKLIIKKTMEQFFGYVAEKDNESGAYYGKEKTRERWVQYVQDPSFIVNRRYTKLWHEGVAETFHGNQNALTWQMVMRSEIDTLDVEKTIGQNPTDRTIDYAKGILSDVERWGRQDVLGWAMPAAVNFWNTLGNKADNVQKWLGEMGQAGATQLHFGKQYVEYLFEGNKHTLRRFRDDHIELIVDGVKLPFAIIYGADQMLVPWATTKIRQIQEMLREDKLTSTKAGGILQAKDIMVNSGLFGRDERDLSKNREFAYFGIYQRPFLEAFKKADKFQKLEAPGNIHDHIGYFISTVEKKDIDYAKGVDPAEIALKMQVESFKRARAKFIEQGAPQDQVDRLMYPIHTVVQKGVKSEEVTPERMYVFWRMPMPGSEENTLKTAPGNRWPDYMDPNKYKDRPPFIVDPAKGLMENLKEAFGLNLETTREVFGAGGVFFAQWIRVAIFIPEKVVGKGLGAALKAMPSANLKALGKWVEDLASMDEKNKQWLDETLTSAGTADLAISDFYAEAQNAWLYKAALDFAQENHQDDLYLGYVDSRFKGPRESKKYMTPTGPDQATFDDWVKNVYIPGGHPEPKGFKY